MKISLIRPANETSYFDPEIQEPLGIETLAGFLESHGHKLQILDAVLTGQTEKALIRQTAAFQPDALGVSLMSGSELESANRIMLGVRNYCPRVLLVAGGNLVSTEPLKVVNFLPPDTICIRYEGEIPWLQIVEAFNQQISIREINSAVIKTVNGELIETSLGKPISNLDTIPDAKRAFVSEVSRLNLAVNVQASRGCVGTCTYCCSPGFPSAEKGRRRDKSPTRIVDELQAIVERDRLRIFNFVDDDFLGPEREVKERVNKFADQITRRGLKISFGIQARPYSLDRESIQLLAKSGLSYVFFGIETDAEADLRRWGRRQPNYDLGELVKMLRDHNIEPQAGCIPFHPQTTISDLKRLAKWLIKHGLLNYRTATNRLQALPGSVMYAELKKTGQIQEDTTRPVLPSFQDAKVEAFYQDLILALDPLRAVWVMAASKLPVAKARANLLEESYLEGYACLQQVTRTLDDQTGRILFQLIEAYEAGQDERQLINKMRVATLGKAVEMNRLLFRNGIVESEDRLREIIRVDCGL